MKRIPAILLPLFFSCCLSAQPAIRQYNKGVKWAAKINYQKAIGFFTKAIQSDPVLTEAYFNRALAKSKLADYHGAIADYSKAIQLRPGFAMAYNNRGCDKNELMEFAGALEDYTKAIRQDSAYAMAWYNRGMVKTALEDYASAISDFLQVNALQPDYPGIAEQVKKAQTGLVKKYWYVLTAVNINR